MYRGRSDLCCSVLIFFRFIHASRMRVYAHADIAGINNQNKSDLLRIDHEPLFINDFCLREQAIDLSR